MAVDTFLKVDGIKGESKDSAHKDEIDVLGWSWGMSQSGTFGTGGGGGAGKVNVQDVTVTKYVDASSPDLMLHCCNGKHIPKATLVVRKAGENPVEYVVINFEKLLVSSVSTGGAGGEERLTENVTFNFSNFEVEYKPQADTGGGEAPIKIGWDILANKKK
jgi:type VI secretion system secreted protein Hcp